MSTSRLLRNRIETVGSLLEMQRQLQALEAKFADLVNDTNVSELSRREASTDAHLLSSLQTFMASHIKRFQAVSK